MITLVMVTAVLQCNRYTILNSARIYIYLRFGEQSEQCLKFVCVRQVIVKLSPDHLVIVNTQFINNYSWNQMLMI